MDIIYRKLSDLRPSPKNPRKVEPGAVEELAKSIQKNPHFFEARPILLSDRTGELVIIAGERRSEAAAFLGMDKVPTILMSGLTEAQEDEIMIRDNTHTGVWDDKKLEELKHKWGGVLKDWGVDIKEKKMTEILSQEKYTPVYYEPQNRPEINLLDCIDFGKFQEKIEVIENAKIKTKEKEVLKWFAYRFLKIDFEGVANYYYFNATPQEQEIIERLRLVLIDGGEQGFIDDDLLRIAQYATQEEENND